jgi:hypothetical protein
MTLRKLSCVVLLVALGWFATPAGAAITSMLACLPPSGEMNMSDRTDGVSELPGYG